MMMMSKLPDSIVGYAGLALGLVEIEGVKAERLAGNVGGVESQIVAAPVVAGGEVERRPEFFRSAKLMSIACHRR